MKVLYFDCAAGAAGDMILGALLDAGLPEAALRAALGSLAVEGCDVRVDRVLRGGVSAAKFRVLERGHDHAAAAAGADPHGQARDHHAHAHHSHGHDAHQHARSQGAGHAHEHRHGHGHGQDHEHRHDHGHAPGHHHDHGHAHGHVHRTLPEITALIERSALSAAGKARAVALFRRLAEAEAAVHAMPVADVFLHEVGALDSIVDIVGCVFALEWFAADRIVASPINVGSGTVQAAHGRLAVPAPATLRLLGDAPVYAAGPAMELTTPTGALIVTDYADAFGPLPAMRVTASGYGAGDRDPTGMPNVLRVLVGEADAAAPAMRVSVVECEIDDMNPQIFGAVMDRLYAAGALEVFYVPVQMKKNRPGTLLTVVCRPEQRADLCALLFRETTTIGVRHHDVLRECLDREMVAVDTAAGTVRFKVARRDGVILNAQPEFDDLARLAAAQGVPIKQVQAMAVKAWQDHDRDS